MSQTHEDPDNELPRPPATDAGDGELTPGETPGPNPDHREPVLDPETGRTDVQDEEGQE